MTDHFAALGLTPDADDREIRTAYRLLARKLHPDMNTGLPIEAFHAVQAAWDVLKNPSSREKHVMELSRGPRQSSESWGRPTRRQRGIDPTDPEALSRVTFDVHADAEVRRFGGRVMVRLPVETECPGCQGAPMERRNCDLCSGLGRLRLRVRATLSVPPGPASPERLRVSGHMELFGPFETWARIRNA